MSAKSKKRSNELSVVFVDHRVQQRISFSTNIHKHCNQSNCSDNKKKKTKRNSEFVVGSSEQLIIIFFIIISILGQHKRRIAQVYR